MNTYCSMLARSEKAWVTSVKKDTSSQWLLQMVGKTAKQNTPFTKGIFLSISYQQTDFSLHVYVPQSALQTVTDSNEWSRKAGNNRTYAPQKWAHIYSRQAHTCLKQSLYQWLRNIIRTPDDAKQVVWWGFVIRWPFSVKQHLIVKHRYCSIHVTQSHSASI